MRTALGPSLANCGEGVCGVSSVGSPAGVELRSLPTNRTMCGRLGGSHQASVTSQSIREPKFLLWLRLEVCGRTA